MRPQAVFLLALLSAVGLVSCTAPRGETAPSPPQPPPWEEQDRTAYNNQQVFLFVSRDSGWQAWLNAILASQRANDLLVDSSRYNTPVWTIIQAITAAQDAYRVATSFNLPPFTVTSSCLNLSSEVNGATQLLNGLIIRYQGFTTQTKVFENGSACVVSVGFVDEIDTSRGMPVAVADRDTAIDWSESFSRYLVWRQPYWKISTGATLSLSDLMGLIEH